MFTGVSGPGCDLVDNCKSLKGLFSVLQLDGKLIFPPGLAVLEFLIGAWSHNCGFNCNIHRTFSFKVLIRFIMKNYVSKLNEHAQKTKSRLRYEEVGCVGPDHNKTFTIRVVLNNNTFPEGVGKNKKEAKQKAAEYAWKALMQKSTDSLKPTTLPKEDKESSQSVNSGWSCYTGASASNKKPTTMSEENKQNGLSEDSASWGIDTGALASSKKDSDNNGDSTGSHQTMERFKQDFEVIDKIGRGAFGWVLKVRHKVDGKLYAVKIVQSRRKAVREVEALSGLAHGNIVRYFTCWEEESGYEVDGSSDGFDSSPGWPTGSPPPCYLYIQMELCAKQTLTKWISAKDSKSQNVFQRRQESLQIALQLTSGVKYIHSRGFIHRDLKPDNILFGLQDDIVKIGDFGLVTTDGILTERTADAGTPSYMAPEQKNKNYDRKVDIFSLGLIFLELWWKVSSGHERGKVFEDARRQELPQEFPHVFFEESPVIRSMLSGSPEGRPEASEVNKKLEMLATKE